jgi:hypothetical protein
MDGRMALFEQQVKKLFLGGKFKDISFPTKEWVVRREMVNEVFLQSKLHTKFSNCSIEDQVNTIEAKLCGDV